MTVWLAGLPIHVASLVTNGFLYADGYPRICVAPALSTVQMLMPLAYSSIRWWSLEAEGHIAVCRHLALYANGSIKSRRQLLRLLAKLSLPLVSSTSYAFFLFRYGFYKIFECFVIASADPRRIHMARAILSFSKKKRKGYTWPGLCLWCDRVSVTI
jgi:hypothetical protein